jgi:hypothetical protein
MGTQRTSFEKLQRDRAKKAKAAAKREKRFDKVGRVEDAGDEATAPLLHDDGKPLSPAELLALVETIHRQFEAGAIDQDEFEERKAEIFARLPVD